MSQTLTAEAYKNSPKALALAAKMALRDGHYKVVLVKEGDSRQRVTVVPTAAAAIEEVKQIMRDRHIQHMVAWNGTGSKSTANLSCRLGNGKEMKWVVTVEPTTEPLLNYGGGISAI